MELYSSSLSSSNYFFFSIYAFFSTTLDLAYSNLVSRRYLFDFMDNFLPIVLKSSAMDSRFFSCCTALKSIVLSRFSKSYCKSLIIRYVYRSSTLASRMFLLVHIEHIRPTSSLFEAQMEHLVRARLFIGPKPTNL